MYLKLIKIVTYMLETCSRHKNNWQTNENVKPDYLTNYNLAVKEYQKDTFIACTSIYEYVRRKLKWYTLFFCRRTTGVHRYQRVRSITLGFQKSKINIRLREDSGIPSLSHRSLQPGYVLLRLPCFVRQSIHYVCVHTFISWSISLFVIHNDDVVPFRILLLALCMKYGTMIQKA